MDVNLRYESVDDNAPSGTDDKSGSALTIRTRLGYETGDFKGFTGFVEYSGTESIGDRTDYFVPPISPDGGRDASKSVILDPAVTRLNQAWVNYKVSKTNIKAGQQRIIMDSRFLGNVGFRQTEQVYTGVRAIVKEIDKVKIDYSYIMQTRNAIDAEFPMQTHGLKLDLDMIPSAKIEGYAYLIDYEEDKAPIAVTDSQTLGARVSGKPALSEGLKLVYHLEYADQSDYGDSDDIGGEYYHAQLGVNVKGITALVAQETLGGDGTSSFQTPLATLHPYNGFADKFLSTPVNGLVDSYAKVAGKVAGFKVAAFYHDFKADKGGDAYGSEIDLLVAKKFAKIYTVGVKYANYDGDKNAATTALQTDTSKFWVWANVKF